MRTTLWVGGGLFAVGGEARPVCAEANVRESRGSNRLASGWPRGDLDLLSSFRLGLCGLHWPWASST